MSVLFNWDAALLDLRARRALDATQGKQPVRRRRAPFRYVYGAPFIEYEPRQTNHIGPRDVLDADAFERRR